MLRVRDAMTREVLTLGPEASAAEAVDICERERIKHLPIVEGGRLIGLVSDRDLRSVAGAAQSAGGSNGLREVKVRDMMTRDVDTAHPLDTLDHATRRLHDRKIGCLPVVDEEELVGIVTSSDMLQILTELMGGFGVGSWLEVEVPNQPGALAEVFDVLRESRVNVTSVFLAPTQRAAYRVHAATHRIAVLRMESTHPHDVARRLQNEGFNARGVESSAPASPTIEES